MLEEHNPWWKGKDFIEDDEDYRKWRESKTKWIPSLAKRIELRPFSLHFIFGTRQVGKTTLVKLIIKDLLERGVNPETIFYFRCDGLADHRELSYVLEEYLKLREAKNIESSYIFLDEITFPKEWYRSIKLLIDMGKLKNDVLILTGSLSMFAKGEVETFPGRRGHGENFVMHPLSFRDFVRVVDKKLGGELEQFESLRAEEVREKVARLIPWLKELNKHFETYLECGGFPPAIKHFVESGRIPHDVEETYLSGVMGDLSKLKRNEAIAKRVLKAIVEKVPSTLSLYSVSKEFEIKSHKTVFSYLNLFEKMFLAKTLNFIEPNRAIEVLYKEKKVHLTDPFLYKVFSRWCLTKKPEESVVVESVVATHLSRKYETFYWKNRTEIDIVVKDGEELRGFEVKWKEKVEGEERSVGKIKEFITLSKVNFNVKPLVVPVSIFLACLEL